MASLVARLVRQFDAPIDYAVAYGSAVKLQKNHDASVRLDLPYPALSSSTGPSNPCLVLSLPLSNPNLVPYWPLPLPCPPLPRLVQYCPLP